jgi:hypothetical protein
MIEKSMRERWERRPGNDRAGIRYAWSGEDAAEWDLPPEFHDETERRGVYIERVTDEDGGNLRLEIVVMGHDGMLGVWALPRR